MSCTICAGSEVCWPTVAAMEACQDTFWSAPAMSRDADGKVACAPRVVDAAAIDDDDDGLGGGSELVMSGGLVAIGLTFTGISIAAIANALQEQCALGPTIVYEAGTTHPYYITPNLCTIGAHTYSRPRRLCATRRRARCAASSAKRRPLLGSWRSSRCTA